MCMCMRMCRQIQAEETHVTLLVEQHVLELDVAVGDRARVQVGEGADQLTNQPAHLRVSGLGLG